MFNFLNLSDLPLLAGLGFGQTVLSTADRPVVDLGYVKYAGYNNATSGISYFKGIRYAQTPIDDLRWRKPQPIEAKHPYNGRLVDASKVGPACFQAQAGSTYYDAVPGTFAYTPQPQSEDCLLLDVLKPMRPAKPSLPVMVQIHGGDYAHGHAQTAPGDALVHASRGSVIYVSIQYRLSLFGFLGGSAIADDGALNAGLLDQRLALEWVQRHIKAFGGDPARVTIVGGSAGGGSVSLQLTAYGAQDNPPFAAAIAEYPAWEPFFNKTAQDTIFHRALDLVGCRDLECLRHQPTEVLGWLNQALQNASYPQPDVGYGFSVLQPVVDGSFVQDLPSVMFKKGKFHDVPLLVDHDGYEGVLFSNRSQTTQTDETTDLKAWFPQAGPAFSSRLYELYPQSDYNSTFFQRQAWFGDVMFSCPTYLMAFQAVEHKQDPKAVYKLIFDAGTQLHGATTFYIFSDDISWSMATNKTLAKIMTSYFVSFVIYGDPNTGRAPQAPFFPSYGQGGLGTSTTGESVGFSILSVTYGGIEARRDSDANEKCEFIANNGYVVMN